MNKRQYTMFMTMLNAKGVANVKTLCFTIKPLVGKKYSLVLANGNSDTVLNIGSYSDCVDAAGDYLQMTYNIVD